MKKLYSFVLLMMLSIVGASAAKTVYLKPSSNWLQDGARFALYMFGDSGNGWASFSPVAGDNGVYSASFDEAYSKMILVRMNGAATENSWDNKWNQSADLDAPAENNLLYTVPAGQWDNFTVTPTAYVAPKDDTTDPYENVKITPADHSVAKSLQQFTIDFTAYEEAMMLEGEEPYLLKDDAKSADGELIDNGDGTFLIYFLEEKTAPGQYRLIIPAGRFYVDGKMNDELGFLYTIEGNSVVVNPAPGEVERLSQFTIDYNFYLELDGKEKAYLFNEGTEAEVSATLAEVGGKRLVVTLAEEVTAPGEYQLNVEGVKKMDGTYAPDLQLLYTIKDASVADNNYYYILGDFFGWDNPKQMEQSADDANVYTLTIDVTVEAKKYEYKLRQGDNWDGYQIPANGNYDFVFGTDMYPVGDYTLTFTANVAEGTLKLDVVKKGGAVDDPTEVTIDFAEAIECEGSFVKTFSSKYALDFASVEGVKAYVGKKNIKYDYASGVDASEVLLTPVTVVPAGTGVVLKADQAKAYTVSVTTEPADAFDNDLLVAAEKNDLYPLVDGYYKGVGKLDKRHVEYFDYYTLSDVEEDFVGFFSVDVPAEAGVSFLEEGDVYISLDMEELSQMRYSNDVATLVFTDKEVPAVESIAALKAMSDGDVTLKLENTAQVTAVGNGTIAIQDNTGGLFLSGMNLDVKPGDIISGELVGTFDGTLLYPALKQNSQTDVSKVVVAGNVALEPAVVSAVEAFEEPYVMTLVKLTDLTLKVVSGFYGDEYTLVDADGTEIPVEGTFAAEALQDLKDGTALAEVTGIAWIIPESSLYASWYASLYNFSVVSAKVAGKAEHVYSIVGEFSSWDDDLLMTKSEEDENVYTLVIDNFEVSADKLVYAYKLRADYAWGGYELPADGNNQYFTFDAPGVYTLTFTANVAEHKLTLVAEPVAEKEFTVAFLNVPGWSAVYAYVWNGDGENATPLVAWPGVELLPNSEQGQYEGEYYNVYSYTFTAVKAPDYIIFSNGKNLDNDGAQTHDLEFVNGKTYVVTQQDIITGVYGITADQQDAVIYNMQGVRIDKAQRGLNIINGKKVMVK